MNTLTHSHVCKCVYTMYKALPSVSHWRRGLWFCVAHSFSVLNVSHDRAVGRSWCRDRIHPPSWLRRDPWLEPHAQRAGHPYTTPLPPPLPWCHSHLFQLTHCTCSWYCSDCPYCWKKLLMMLAVSASLRRASLSPYPPPSAHLHRSQGARLEKSFSLAE